MTEPSPRLTVALAVVILIAGCAAPFQDETAPGDSGEIAVEGAGLPVDPGTAFDRVTRLTGTNVTPPDSIRVVTPADRRNASGNDPGFDPAPAFFEVMGVDSEGGLNESEAATLENGRTNLGTGAITMYTGANDSRTVHYVLAHEFVHYVQAARDRSVTLRDSLDSTTDAEFVFGSLLEGAAVYTTDAYIARHIDGNVTNSELYVDIRERLGAGSYPAYTNSRYIAGWRYLEERDPRYDAMDSVYENPPRTGEQVIHGLAPGSEPPRNLSVTENTGAYRRIGTDRLGEGFLRIALRNGLDRNRANAAAAGWGNDSLRTYRPRSGGSAAYAWVLRFDDADNRTEFASAFEDSLATRGTRTEEGWRINGTTFGLERVSSDSVVVFIGTDQFVRNTSVSGGDGNVSITLPESAGVTAGKS
ncbi:MAG: hypothetical protein ABEH88_08855 [Halobacteriales archaeon]